jgi:hypothetical protein
MKYLLLIILFVFTFNAIYSQKNNENTSGSSERPIVKSKSNIRNNRAIKNKDLCVFFNANVDTLFIELSALKEGGKSATIYLYNSFENEILSLKTTEFLNKIPVHNYSVGRYFLKVKMQKNTIKETFEIPSVK